MKDEEADIAEAQAEFEETEAKKKVKSSQINVVKLWILHNQKFYELFYFF